jgi:HipA-like protein
MRSAGVYFKGCHAGLLVQQDDGSFIFRYADPWVSDSSKPPISLTFPKDKREFHSPCLFPFFYNMLPEGSNKQFINRSLKIDPDDAFGLLLATAQTDAIGAITLKPSES